MDKGPPPKEETTLERVLYHLRRNPPPFSVREIGEKNLIGLQAQEGLIRLKQPSNHPIKPLDLETLGQPLRVPSHLESCFAVTQ